MLNRDFVRLIVVTVFAVIRELATDDSQAERVDGNVSSLDPAKPTCDPVQSSSVATIPYGGNPGSCLVVNTVSSSRSDAARAVMRSPQWTWNPATQGPIKTLQFSIDAKYGGVGPTDVGQRIRPIILQANRLYCVGSMSSGSSPDWSTVTFDVAHAEEWTDIGNAFSADGSVNESTKPDFTMDGAPLIFGFWVTNSASTTIVRHYDNMKVIVELDRSVGSASPVGVGCSAHSPTLASTIPIHGGALKASLTGASASTPVTMLAGLPGTAPLSGGNGCGLFIEPSWLTLISVGRTDANGTLVLATRIPCDPILFGLDVSVQSVLQPTTGPVGFDLSNGVQLHVGP